MLKASGFFSMPIALLCERSSRLVQLLLLSAREGTLAIHIQQAALEIGLVSLRCSLSRRPLLFELLSGRNLASVRKSSTDAIPTLNELPLRGPPIAKQLVELVARALAFAPSQRFRDPEEMARAISELPSHWLGSEAQVSAAIEPLAHRAADLKASEPSLDLSSGEHMVDDPWEIPTRSLRLRVPSPEDDRQTVRPEEPSTASVEPKAPEATQASAEGAAPVAKEKQASVATRIARRMRLFVVPTLIFFGGHSAERHAYAEPSLDAPLAAHTPPNGI